MSACGKSLGEHTCIRPRLHGGACRSASGRWWAQYDSGRDDQEAYVPLLPDPYANQDMREVWR